MTDPTLKLIGRIFLTFNIHLMTGLHIGGSNESISIGGVDKTVARDPLTNQPYIPGSSLRGKIRSLTEKYLGLPQNDDIGGVRIHTAKTEDEYFKSPLCQIYGVAASEISLPTRLIVRDVSMSEESKEKLEGLRTSLPFTEIKTEVAIDRITSTANPRQIERVPAGTLFHEAQMIYSLYDYDHEQVTPAKELERFELVITGLQLLEDDYLGGLGSRGSGRVALKDIRLKVKASHDYDNLKACHPDEGGYKDLDSLRNDLDGLKQRLAHHLKIEG